MFLTGISFSLHMFSSHKSSNHMVQCSAVEYIARNVIYFSVFQYSYGLPVTALSPQAMYQVIREAVLIYRVCRLAFSGLKIS